MNIEARRKALEAFRLLATDDVGNHIDGLNLLDEARRIDATEVAKIEAALEQEIEVDEDTVL